MKKINTACLWNLSIYNKNNHKTKEPWVFHQTKIFVIENSSLKKRTPKIGKLLKTLHPEQPQQL